MQWTTEKPEKPGWYWRRKLDGTVSIVHVTDREADGYLMAEDSYTRWPIEHLLGEWAGPIEPPP